MTMARLRTEQASENAQHRRMQVYAIRDDLACTVGASATAPIGPGWRWCSGGIALQQWVACVAPS